MVSLVFLKPVILLLWQLLQLLLLVSPQMEDCPPSFDCGYLGSIQFPFTTTQRPSCGLWDIHGCEQDPSYTNTTLQLYDSAFKWYTVLGVHSGTIMIKDKEQELYLQTKNCKAFDNTFTLPDASPLASFYVKYNITIFRCNRSHRITLPKYFYRYSNCSEHDIYYVPLNTETTPGFKWPSSLAPCSRIQLAISDNLPDDPFQYLSAVNSVEVQLSADCDKCLREKGQCLLDSKGKLYCTKDDEILLEKIVLGLGLVSAVLAVGVPLMVSACCFARKILRRKNPAHRIIEGFLKERGPLPTVRYNYSEVKKMTNSFKKKLGGGGFGSVYKGKLYDGRVVAVKILSKSDANGEDFINEVASISRTSHVNIVRLLGFCLDRSKRALIYEFMSNGSLDKFIYEDNNPLQVSHQLDCKILYDIAIGIARGLEYLHRGCNTRILHFDIKPHNILLDENFCPKISDFGLAKLCSRRQSAVSIFGARGTVGYIAPEVFSRHFGVVSHKSDVYSYGMMVLEMVGMKNNIKAEVNRSSDAYFPHWIYNRLESDQQLGLQDIRNESDEMVRKMTIVGLWCIQTYPPTRPGISKVVEMLESKAELLQIPPKPCLPSSSTSLIHLSSETL
ncbi:hypothetical protein Fmac_023173 [Flemingia macrophylla]|uniref:Protein kinase domain-containing protein n=1 Tax=Flemingia macrophylla TaxID=520843 RepID=A0ABD1LKT4_9FABA